MLSLSCLAEMNAPIYTFCNEFSFAPSLPLGYICVHVCIHCMHVYYRRMSVLNHYNTVF